VSPNPPNPGNLAALQQAYSNVCNLLVVITTRPKPTYSIDGQNVSWETYYKTLTEQQKALNEQIQIAGGVFELQTQMIPGGGGVPGIWPM
jgi:hypothetical protein